MAANTSVRTLSFLESVLPWLHADDITRLWISGSPAVRSILSRESAVPTMYYKARDTEASFPNFLPLPFARHIRVLRLISASPSVAINVRHCKLDDLPPTLHTIEIESHDSGDLFARPNLPDQLVGDLNARFPVLEELILGYSASQSWIGGDMNALPRSLRRFRLSVMRHQNSFNMSALANLTEFVVNFAIMPASSSSSCTDMSAFPTSLTKLQMSSDRQLFSGMVKKMTPEDDISALRMKLPSALPELQYLEVSVLAPAADLTIAVMSLPRLLKHLILGSSQLNPACVKELPAGLETLVCIFQDESQPLAFLPRGLTRLEARSFYSSDKFIDLPLTLRRLLIGVSSIADGSLDTLPRGIDDLHLIPRAALSDYDITLLPPNMTSLTINPANSIPTDSLHLLPSTLTKLVLDSLPNASEDTVKSFPRGLLSLTLPNTQRIESIENLPPGLHTFQAPIVATLGADEIAMLPKCLKILIIPLCTGIPSTILKDLPELQRLSVNFSNVLEKGYFHQAFQKDLQSGLRDHYTERITPNLVS